MGGAFCYRDDHRFHIRAAHLAKSTVTNLSGALLLLACLSQGCSLKFGEHFEATRPHLYLYSSTAPLLHTHNFGSTGIDMINKFYDDGPASLEGFLRKWRTDLPTPGVTIFPPSEELIRMMMVAGEKTWLELEFYKF
jgi:hypothetical protein